MTEPRDSLTDRLARGAARATWRWPALPPLDLRLAAALAGTIALGPLLGIVGAQLLRATIEAENRDLAMQLEARLAPEAARRTGWETLRDAVRQPTMSATLERLAHALPDDARLVSAARGADGRVAVEIATGDPDQLRAALRRDPKLSGMQERGQRRSRDARVIVTLRSRS